VFTTYNIKIIFILPHTVSLSHVSDSKYRIIFSTVLVDLFLQWKGSSSCVVVSEFIFIIYLFSVTLRPNAGHGLHIVEVSILHTTTHHSR